MVNCQVMATMTHEGSQTTMKIEIELSKNVDYSGEILGEYIWNLEEGDNHVTGFCNSIGQCFEEIIRHK